MTGDKDASDLVENWLGQPWQYRSLRKQLYLQLVENLHPYFKDSRPAWKFYADGVFEFHTQGYFQSWAALRDLCRLTKESGLSGLIILFDEFEDVVTNLRNVKFQEDAFWNLFVFYSGKQFPGKTYFAVTPEFVAKCKKLLVDKDRWDFDLSRFDALPSFAMSPLGMSHLQRLARRIVEIHGAAYSWDARSIAGPSAIHAALEDANSLQVQDRTRRAIIAVVETLDDLLQNMKLPPTSSRV